MDSAFGNWKSTAIGLGLTAIIVGAGMAIALS